MGGRENQGGARRPIAIKVYVVLQRDNLARDGQPNVSILAVRLTKKAAQEISDRIPGTKVEKHLAIKYDPPPGYRVLDNGRVVPDH